MSGETTYAIEFSDDDWEEIQTLTFAPFEFASGESLTEGQWMALGDMALGKAQRIDAGAYSDGGWGEDQKDFKIWAAQLRAIAVVIFTRFAPPKDQEAP